MSVDPKHTIHELTGWRYGVIWLMAKLMQLWCRTLRFELPQGEERLFAITSGEKPLLVFFWHNSLFTIADIHRRFGQGRPVGGLVSASKDGAYLAAFFRAMGINAIRGSSSRRGAAAIREIREALSSGMDMAITPDGPRGPRYDLKPGAAWLAKEAGVPLLFFRVQHTRFWRLGSWDGFYVPLPFSRVRLWLSYFEDVRGLTGEADPSIEAVTACMKKTFDALYRNP